MIRLGLVSAILPELSLAEVLDVCARERLDCAELMCWPVGPADRRYAGVTHIDVTALGEDRGAKPKEQITKSGVAVSALGYYPNVLSPDTRESETTLEHLRRVIVAARLLDIGLVNTFIGRDWTRSLRENWTRFREVWPPLIRFAEAVLRAMTALVPVATHSYLNTAGPFWPVDRPVEAEERACDASVL